MSIYRFYVLQFSLLASCQPPKANSVKTVNERELIGKDFSLIQLPTF